MYVLSIVSLDLEKVGLLIFGMGRKVKLSCQLSGRTEGGNTHQAIAD